ncbi:MAG: hypothetical protein KJ749_12310 [Planctomycetes bacterium]|nr:hypothetical protein [Planctomycetota bacterium]
MCRAQGSIWVVAFAIVVGSASSFSQVGEVDSQREAVLQVLEGSAAELVTGVAVTSPSTDECACLCDLHVTACELVCGGELSCGICEQIAGSCMEACFSQGGFGTDVTCEQLSAWIAGYNAPPLPPGKPWADQYQSSYSQQDRVDLLVLTDGYTRRQHNPTYSCCWVAESASEGACLPSAVDDPSYPNGCGTDEIDVPDNYGSVSFSNCCDKHDCCYNCCAEPLVTRRMCEDAFHLCLHQQCPWSNFDSLVRTHPIVRRRGPGVAMRIGVTV